ncbi:MAG: hypothetical protein ACE5JV_00570 [Nitrososphaerales archaeon]
MRQKAGDAIRNMPSDQLGRLIEFIKNGNNLSSEQSRQMRLRTSSEKDNVFKAILPNGKVVLEAVNSPFSDSQQNLIHQYLIESINQPP